MKKKQNSIYFTKLSDAFDLFDGDKTKTVDVKYMEFFFSSIRLPSIPPLNLSLNLLLLQPLLSLSPFLNKPKKTKTFQNLVEKILRTRIYDTVYWKQHCFGLTAASLLDKAVELRSVGGGGGSAVSGGAGPPSRFICLVLKLLQLQPDRDVVLEYIKNEDHKYVRLLGAFYLRLTARPAEVYKVLEPLLEDRRRVRARASASASSAVGVETGTNATYALTHVDELVDAMLSSPYLFDVALPRLPPRATLQAAGQLPVGVPRRSSMRAEFERVWEEERPEREGERERRRRRAEEGGEGGEEAGEEQRRRERRRCDEDGELSEEEREERGGGERRDDGRRRERWRLSPPRRGGGGGSDRDRRRARSRSRSRSPCRRRDDGDEHGYRRHSRSRDRGNGRGNDDDDRGKRPRRGQDEEGEISGGGGGGKKDGLSVAETNALRARLGLAPLK